MEMEEIARWAYIAFVAIAIVMGLAIGYMASTAEPDQGIIDKYPDDPYRQHWETSDVKNINGYITLIMLILGIVIGITSITAKEVTPFLIATIALIVATVANVWVPLGNIHELLYYWATGILNYIVAFAAPAAVIIAVKSVLAMAKD